MITTIEKTISDSRIDYIMGFEDNGAHLIDNTKALLHYIKVNQMPDVWHIIHETRSLPTHATSFLNGLKYTPFVNVGIWKQTQCNTSHGTSIRMEVVVLNLTATLGL
jgi:hypothetical protein